VSVRHEHETELVWRDPAEHIDAGIALPAAANQGAVKLRFRLTSDNSENREGWSIDNVKLRAGGAACQVPVDVLFADGFE
jgi:hypothetical protein